MKICKISTSLTKTLLGIICDSVNHIEPVYISNWDDSHELGLESSDSCCSRGRAKPSLNWHQTQHLRRFGQSILGRADGDIGTGQLPQESKLCRKRLEPCAKRIPTLTALAFHSKCQVTAMVSLECTVNNVLHLSC